MRILEAATPWVYRALDLAAAPWSHGATVRLARALVWCAGDESKLAWKTALLDALDQGSELDPALVLFQRHLPPSVPARGKPADWTTSEVADLMNASPESLQAFLRHVELRRAAFLPRASLASERGLETRAFAASALFCATTRTGDLRYANAGLKIVDSIRATAPRAMISARRAAGPALSLATALLYQESALRAVEGR